MRTVGTVVRGIRAPIFKQGDDLASLTLECILNASKEEGFAFRDGDVLAITESTLARTQGNYATVEQIAKDVRAKIPGGVAGIVLPILSRNRFSLLLKGISMGLDKLYIQLAYPSDEVGNHLISMDDLDEKGINPFTDVLSEQRYRELFGEEVLHPFTGMDYVRLYKEIAPNSEIFLANDVREMLNYTKHVICCDIHTRARSVRLLKNAGAETAITMADILNKSVDGSGYNPEYGLYGSNLSDETTVKLFPRDCEEFVTRLQAKLIAATGKRIEVMVYGDGAFKDPVGKIWELADPVVAPGYTAGLAGTPNELKLKYLADTSFKGMTEEEAAEHAREAIRAKDADLQGKMASQGTTPRRLTDLIGSLCDLTSGSGDKGTPIVFIQGYFDNYADEY
ncbi:MAG: coenzyme F420-0:L-glutamate ligase [Eubacteriales bacterium]|nr:coenzyme F420-0:L-glutamate ligase [Eubacteriales bacterium]